MKSLILSSVLALACVGCATEKQVSITMVTSTRDSTIVVDDQFIEMTEGQAIGIHVEAFAADEPKPHWRIRATSENGSYVDVAGTKDEGVFVVIAERPGSTNLRFELRERDFVYVPVLIHPRDERTPPAAGGASPD